jgi:DNA-binding NarL/FixJ family response regulator
VIRLLLSDDHPVVRAGIRALLESEADLEVVAEAATAEDAVRLAAASDVDLVLMDLQFPGSMQGAEATRRIRSHDAAPRVLVLTNYDTDADILGAIEAGASGYLLKDRPTRRARGRSACRGRSASRPWHRRCRPGSTRRSRAASGSPSARRRCSRSSPRAVRTATSGARSSSARPP